MLKRRIWGYGAYLFGMGMFLYSVVDSIGVFEHEGNIIAAIAEFWWPVWILIIRKRDAGQPREA